MKIIKETLLECAAKVRRPVPEDSLDNRTRKRNQMRFYITQKRRMRAIRIVPALPYIRIELYMEQAKEVTSVRYFGYDHTGYAVCPNCGYALEREFQKHCDQCGQLLGWKKFRRDEVTRQRITGPKS